MRICRAPSPLGCRSPPRAPCRRDLCGKKLRSKLSLGRLCPLVSMVGGATSASLATTPCLLYIYSRDKGAQPTCYDECAIRSPPYIVGARDNLGPKSGWRVEKKLSLEQGDKNEAKVHICSSRDRFGANCTIKCAIRLACWSLHQETRRRRRNACRKNRRGLACFCHGRRDTAGRCYGRRLYADHRRRNQRQYFPRRNQIPACTR